MTRSSLLNALRSRTAAVSVIAGILGAAGCSEPAPAPSTTPATPASKSPEARVQFYKDCWRAFNDKDWDKFAPCYTADAVSESVDSNPASTTGRDAIVAGEKARAGAFPDARGDLQLILANGDRILGIAAYTGTNSGPMTGPDGKQIPATNKKVGLYMAHTVTFDATGSAAARDAAYMEEGTLMAQLGLNPNPTARKVMASPGDNPTVVIAQNDERERNNLGVVNSMIEAGNKHDLKAIEGFMTDDYKLIEIGQPKDMNKAEAMKGTKEFFAAFPDLTMTPAAKWTAGDYVVIEGSVTGTNKAPMPSMGITKATNKAFTGRFIEVMKFDNNKVKEDWLFYNGMAMAAQLGLIK